MDLDFQNNPDFLETVNKHAQDILKSQREDLINVPNFQILKSKVEDYWINERKAKGILALNIREEDVLSLNVEEIDAFIMELIEALRNYNFVQVNSKLEIVEVSEKRFNDSGEAREFYVNLSKEKIAIIFCAKNISLFIKGEQIGKNIFMEINDYARYIEKYEITDIKLVLEKYINEELTKRSTYCKFFADLATLRLIFKEDYEKYTSTLINEPEHILRDDLLEYFRNNIKGTIQKEVELNSGKELDIHTEVKGNFYFFEIKWIGQSIKKKQKSIEYDTELTVYDERRAQSGMKQTLEYIEELINNMKYQVRFGYLVIFDARVKNTALTYDKEVLPDELKSYLQYFDVFDNLIIRNLKPSG